MFFLHAKDIHSILIDPKVLTLPAAPNLIYISSKSGVGETWGVVNPEAKFLSSSETEKPDSRLRVSKMQWWTGIDQTSFQKEKIVKFLTGPFSNCGKDN